MTTIPDFLPMLRHGTGKTPKDGGCIMQVCDYLDRGEWTDSTPCVHPTLRSAAIRVNDLVTDEDRQKLYLLVPRLMGTSKFAEDKVLSVRLAIWCAYRVLHLVRDDDREVCVAAIEAAERYAEQPNAANAAYAADAANAADAAAYAAYAAYAANAADAAAYAAYAADAAANAAYAADAANAADAAAYAADAAYAANAAAYAAYAAYAANAAYAAYAAKASAQRIIDFTALLDEFDRLTGRIEHPPVTVREWKRIAEAVSA